MNKEIKYNIDCLKSHKFNFDYCLDELLNNFDYLQKQLEAYENMRKELLELILYYFPALDQRESNFKDELFNILNKVGGSDE